jgi:hypothetical protein
MSEPLDATVASGFAFKGAFDLFERRRCTRALRPQKDRLLDYFIRTAND